jgi:Nucleotidyl transferase AbiEii toxin, Type IV TA system
MVANPVATKPSERAARVTTYFQLSAEEQRDALEVAAQASGRPAAMLEKDLWVVWTLEALFALEGQPHDLAGFRGGVVPTMAFKGGTSLSKVYGAIHRFSEDVDIAFDQHAFETGYDVFDASKPSNRILERHQQRELEFANQLLREFIKPKLLERATGSLPSVDISIDEALESDGSLSLIIRYPTLTSDDSIREGVKLEAGGRNPTEPLMRAVIQPDLKAWVPVLEYATPTINVLKAERTFWEKATLIHAECHRPNRDSKSLERRSRHWSDLVELYQSEIGPRALEDLGLLETVVAHKTRFYRSGWARYEQCLSQGFQLVPTDVKMLEWLERDYTQMKRFFYPEAQVRPFAEILEALRALQDELNGT